MKYSKAIISGFVLSTVANISPIFIKRIEVAVQMMMILLMIHGLVSFSSPHGGTCPL
jgi:hypothetical protein